MSGLNPIKKESRERSLDNNLKAAVSLVASAMQQGMLSEEDQELLARGGIRQTEVSQTAYETLNDLLGMAQAVKLRIMDGGVMKIEDPSELATNVNVIVKLMSMVRKSMSEARRNEELTALESALHECLSDIQEGVSGNPDAEKVVETSMKGMMRNLEDRLKQIQDKYDD